MRTIFTILLATILYISKF